ncbi:polymerase [Salmonella enterica subsp. diarizonae]|uniref:Polymerase n=1 Tax=Salmonella diarizonae TaxID=59204 RepID=A0A379XX12_SALDZ|nr:polymerase [Salmonella enterica subsp. diarizonae]
MIYYIFIVIFPFFSFVKNKNIKIYALMLSFFISCLVLFFTLADWY